MSEIPKELDHFKEVIEAYLKGRARKDLLFLKTFKKPNKNIDDCIKYIVGAVKKSGRSGFTDDEVWNLAVHYYDEDDIKVGELPKNMKVVVNKAIELTEAEKAQAREEARQRVIQEEMDKMRGKTKKKTETVKAKPDAGEAFMGSLFGEMKVVKDDSEDDINEDTEDEEE